MKNNTYFKTMNQTGIEYEKTLKERKAEKDAILKTDDPAALKAWYEREEGFQFPFTNGQTKAYHAWCDTLRSESSTFEVRDLPWPKDTHDFVETLRAAGVTEFAVTDHSTGLMEGLHRLTDEGCTMLGLCKVTRSELRWGNEGVEEYDGILFHA